MAGSAAESIKLLQVAGSVAESIELSSYQVALQGVLLNQSSCELSRTVSVLFICAIFVTKTGGSLGVLRYLKWVFEFVGCV